MHTLQFLPIFFVLKVIANSFHLPIAEPACVFGLPRKFLFSPEINKLNKANSRVVDLTVTLYESGAKCLSIWPTVMTTCSTLSSRNRMESVVEFSFGMFASGSFRNTRPAVVSFFHRHLFFCFLVNLLRPFKKL